MWLRRAGVFVLVLVLVVAVGFTALAWKPAIEPVEPPAPEAFDPDLVAEGAVLSAAGNCVQCHTAEGGAHFAGGFPVPTPFGDIYGTNITPDPETGIGNWSERAFIRSMREGVHRDGTHLYPAFPYTHYRRVSDDDLKALYAFLMTREPVRAETPAPNVPFPLNLRFLLAGWKLLYLPDLEQEVFDPIPRREASWSRGAYLAEGLGHCSTCHTPRNLLGAERQDELYAGGEGEGWHGPALNELAPGPVPWTEEALFAYLRHGYHEHHGVAAGPMAPITRELATIPEEDVRALAIYFDWLTGDADPEQAEAALAAAGEREYNIITTSAVVAEAEPHSGAAIYAGACAVCHVEDTAVHFHTPAPLALSSAVSGPDPRNLIHIILDGINSPPGAPGRQMPGFAGALSDEQILGLVAYVRDHFSDRAPWEDAEERLAEIREQRRQGRGEER